MAVEFKAGDLVRARGREWVVLPDKRPDILKLRPLGGSDDDATLLYLPIEPETPTHATFNPPDPDKSGARQEAILLWDALRLKLKAGAGPFRSFGNLNFEVRAYQLVPLLMALKLDTIRMLIADDVGIGKTIEAGLIARELLDRGEIERLTVICPPHLCDQWQSELAEKFSIDAKVVRTGTANRLERGLTADESIFEVFPYTVVSLDYIKSTRRCEQFLLACPEFIIVDEAHTCVRSNTNTRHQRYELLHALATSKPLRNMVLLTATPHSGDDAAFHNLLGLLRPEFAQLASLVEGKYRRALRGELAGHFVQRRRSDIIEWGAKTSFPVRENRESTYTLTGQWGELFEDVLNYARTMVKRTEGGTVLQQRMSWWAALALLRCASSSPAAASLSLRARLNATVGNSDEEKIQSVDLNAYETVLDEAADDAIRINEGVPAGTVNHLDDASELSELINKANSLHGPKKDPKLKKFLAEIRQLIFDGYRPAVFCRYIATAEYIGDQIRRHLINVNKSIHLEVITGQLNPVERKIRIEGLRELDPKIKPLLVATDCLSEGINLQDFFDAVVHYDLSWNPTRHEQREGRADKFGQRSPTVRTLIFYGQDNPIDGAVLRVIIRKAEKIRKELGVAVPVPTDNDKVVDAIMKAVLLKGEHAGKIRQASFDFDIVEEQVDYAWQIAKERSSRSVFAQRRLRPDEVMSEWKKSTSVLGDQLDVERFIRYASQSLGGPLDYYDDSVSIPIQHFPSQLQERLRSVSLSGLTRITFLHPPPNSVHYIHRAHPLVRTLASYVVEEALDNDTPSIGSRSFAIFTDQIRQRTIIYFLRIRSQIFSYDKTQNLSEMKINATLAEECVAVAREGRGEPRILSDKDAVSMLSIEPTKNMDVVQKKQYLKKAIGDVKTLSNILEKIAIERSEVLLSDHRRIRDASDSRGLRFQVRPAFPVDIIGVYVLIPSFTLS